MANVVTDPKVHPEVIIPDFSKPDPLLTFRKEDIAFVYGTKWKQRYFQKVGDDYFPMAVNGTSRTTSGGRTMPPPVPIGGRNSIRQPTQRARRDRSATAAIL